MKLDKRTLNNFKLKICLILCTTHFFALLKIRKLDRVKEILKNTKNCGKVITSKGRSRYHGSSKTSSHVECIKWNRLLQLALLPINRSKGWRGVEIFKWQRTEQVYSRFYRDSPCSVHDSDVIYHIGQNMRPKITHKFLWS